MAGSAGSLYLRQPVECKGLFAQETASPLEKTAEAIDEVIKKDAPAGKPLLHKDELTFGTFLGFCTGYLIKKVGKLFAIAVGVGFYMSSKGYITVHWDRLEGGYREQLDVDKDGRVTRRDIHSKWQALVGFLTNNLQFKSTFLVGLYAGMRYG
ncbi:hypothetical protein DFQ29_005231 [Apophysomyces sp. BC1021]|nr:hypothetical protein DFQ29_005231 [Apophysomyces sp. BC1021]